MHKLFSDREQHCQLAGREEERLLLMTLASLSWQTGFKVWARNQKCMLPGYLLPHFSTPVPPQWPSGSASAYYGKDGTNNCVVEEAEATIDTIQVGGAQAGKEGSVMLRTH